MKIGTSCDVKDYLVAQFKNLKVEKSGKEWRKSLKTFNSWHLTDEAGHIWRNANRGLAGNEGLRQLVADMSAVLKSEKDRPGVKLSPAQIEQGREKSIALSSSNLRRRRKSIGMAAR